MSEAADNIPIPAPAPATSLTVPQQPKGNRIMLWVSVLCLLVGLGAFGWSRYTGSESYQVRKELSRAEQLARDGEVGQAAQVYFKVADGAPKHADAALAGFKKLLGKTFDEAPLEQVAVVLEMAVRWPDGPHLRDGLDDRAMKLLQEKGEKEIDGALRLLQVINFAAASPRPFTAADQKHLEKLVAEGDELLGAWAKKFRDHIEVLTNYGFALQRKNDAAGIARLLEPHQEKLGTGEGAFLLGQAYAYLGKNEKALALWEPYCAKRLPRYIKAAAEYRKAFTEKQRALQPHLEDGTAADFQYELYRKADEQGKRIIANEYIETRLQDDPDVRAARNELKELKPLPQNVMALGQLQLATARSRIDPAARKAGLEKARETFLSFLEMEPYALKVYLLTGAVAYWMGDPKEGQKQFNIPLVKTNRATVPLLEVAEAYRDVGEVTLARTLLEEAYAKEKDKGNRFEIAFRRSRVPVDTEDELAWLKKCDPDARPFKLYTLQSQARQAEEQGRLTEAADLLRKAIAEVGQLYPESPTRDNETGLFWFWLFRVTGDRDALTKGLDLLDRAVAKAPAQGIIVHNAALNVYQYSSLDLVRDAIDPAVLWTQEGLGLLDFLYNDYPGREEQVTRLSKNAGVARARELAKKLLLLQPRQPMGYKILAPLYAWNHDVKGLQELDSRLREVGLDESEAVGNYLERYSGRNEERQKQERLRAIERWEKLAGEMRTKKKERSLAVALAYLIRTMLRGDMLGEAVDADKVVKLAEEAQAAQLCRATTEKLIDALLYRAHRQLILKDADYKQMAERTRRSLDSAHLIALTLTREGSAKALAVANPDVVRACKLLKERSESFPDEPSPWIYTMLKSTHPDAAVKVAEKLRTDEVQRSLRALSLKLKPLSLADALEHSWALKLEGKEKEGDELLRKLGERGVPLPFDPR